MRFNTPVSSSYSGFASSPPHPSIHVPVFIAQRLEPAGDDSRNWDPNFGQNGFAGAKKKGITVCTTWYY